MSREIIQSQSAPMAIGAYSQAIKADNVVYVSGQIPLVPETMQLVGDKFEDQVRQVFENLTAVAITAGGSLQDAVKLTVYLTDLDNFTELNEIMTCYFRKSYPVRTVVQVSALPKGAQIEIDAILRLS